jgi:hypothetical protein
MSGIAGTKLFITASSKKHWPFLSSEFKPSPQSWSQSRFAGHIRDDAAGFVASIAVVGLMQHFKSSWLSRTTQIVSEPHYGTNGVLTISVPISAEQKFFRAVLLP